MNADLELYRVFCDVVKYKNISKAAENMYISQSAVTQSIQKLESLLGGKVFYRNKTGVELTEEGKNLYEYIKDSIETMKNAENIFSNYTNLEKGKIRIGGGNSLILALVFEPIVKFIKKYPNIEISIVSGITDNLMQQLANGDLDILVFNLPFKNKKYSNIEITSLKKSSYCFFASKKYAKENPINDLHELENEQLILPTTFSVKKQILDEYCQKEDLTLKAKYEASDTLIMKNLVLNDVGIGFTSTENVNDIKDKIQIIKEIETSSTKEGIATLKKNMCNKATIELVKDIKQQYKEHN